MQYLKSIIKPITEITKKLNKLANIAVSPEHLKYIEFPSQLQDCEKGQTASINTGKRFSKLVTIFSIIQFSNSKMWKRKFFVYEQVGVRLETQTGQLEALSMWLKTANPIKKEAKMAKNVAKTSQVEKLNLKSFTSCPLLLYQRTTNNMTLTLTFPIMNKKISLSVMDWTL